MTLRVGIGGPVGSGKTALTLALCRALRERYEIAVVTNDIYTEEDAQFLVATRRSQRSASSASRPAAVRTPRSARRSINLEAVGRLTQRFPDLDLVFHRIRRRQPRRDLQPGLSDLTLYVIDVAAANKIRAKAGRASRNRSAVITRSTSPRWWRIHST